MKNLFYSIWFFIGVFLIVIISFNSFSLGKRMKKQPEKYDVEKKEFTNKEDNLKCLSCHASRKYAMTSADDSSKVIFRKMPLDYMIDSALFYSANHWNMTCTDCHSSGYVKVPHDQELRFDEIPGCMDCHAGDEAFAKYNFEIIDSEFHKSIHSQNRNEDFSCWSCHNPHSYKINARNKHLKITKTVEYDNSICLDCHDNNDNLKYFNKEISNIVKTHNWLSNQEAHFKKVRCIECHAVVNDSILAPHNVQPKNLAVSECSKCHSTNSLLTRSLYRSDKSKDEFGFFNSMILNDSYVAGTTRNYFLNVASLVIYGLALAFIIVHIILRILKNKF